MADRFLRLRGWGLPSNTYAPAVLAVYDTLTDHYTALPVDSYDLPPVVLDDMWEHLEWVTQGRPCGTCGETGHSKPGDECPLARAQYDARRSFGLDAWATMRQLEQFDELLWKTRTVEEVRDLLRRSLRAVRPLF